MRWKLVYLFTLLFFCLSSEAASKRRSSSFSFFELGLNYGYHSQVYGARREAKFTTRTHGGSLAWYLFSYTALEINYSYNREDISDSSRRSVDPNIDIISSHQRVVTSAYGGGIRQALAPRDFLIVPTLSLGYAKQFQQTSEKYVVQNLTTKVIQEYVFATPRRRIDSVFGTFALQFNVTQTFKITASATTVFKYFETNKAKDNVRYLAGISWVF